jgi:hypothetical protein
MVSLRLLAERAWNDIKRGEVSSTYPRDFILAYLDAAVGLATAFLFVELGWKRIYNVDDWRPLLIATLCFFHAVVYWINIHHFIKFSPEDFTVIQVWLAAALSLGLIVYPMALNAWVDGEQNLLYYLVNMWMCSALTMFNMLLDIDTTRVNDLYILYHKVAAPIALFWYSLAFLLSHWGMDVEWMIYIAPFLYMFPLGAERKKQDHKD